MKGNRRFPQVRLLADRGRHPRQARHRVRDGRHPARDPSVREGMKELSSWPTFPQLYVKGAFVGGLRHRAGPCTRLRASCRRRLGVDSASRGEPQQRASAARHLHGRGGEGQGRGRGRRQRRCAAPRGRPAVPVRPALRAEGRVGRRRAVRRRGALSRRRVGVARGRHRDRLRRRPAGSAFKIDNPNEPARVRPIGPGALKALLDAGKVELFDVRPDGERALASIAQAHALDAAGRQRLSGLPKDAAIAFHCHHGGRSRAAAEQLVAQGYTHVYNLEGGVDAWSEQVDPSVARY